MKKIDWKYLSQAIDAEVEKDINEFRISGASILVYQEGCGLFKKCYGYRDFERKLKIEEGTLFRLASMSKPITAVAVLQLFEQGLLDLDMPICNLLPEYEQMWMEKLDDDGCVVGRTPATKKITIRDLLTHSSGLGQGVACAEEYQKIPSTTLSSLETAVRAYADTLLAFEPGSATGYSAFMGFEVLSRIVEIVSGKPFDVYLRENLFAPLGMKDTTFLPTAEQWERLAELSNAEEDTRVNVVIKEGSVFEDFAPSLCSGAAGLASTMEDYFRFCHGLLNSEEEAQGLLKTATIREMRTSQLDQSITPNPEQWGLGVRTITSEDYRLLPVGAYGWSGAYGSHFWIDPVNGVIGIYMKNSIDDGGSGCRTGRGFEKIVTESLR